MKLTKIRWLACIIAAWTAAYTIYFILLLLVDTVLGGRQLLWEWLFESHYILALQLLETVLFSALFALPTVLVVAVVTLVGPGGNRWPALLARALICALIFGVTLTIIGLTAIQAGVFTMALLSSAGIAALTARAWHRVRP